MLVRIPERLKSKFMPKIIQPNADTQVTCDSNQLNTFSFIVKLGNFGLRIGNDGGAVE